MKNLRIHSLERGWCDRDIVLLHASFQILVDFVDTEKPDKIIDWNADPLCQSAWKEIQSLYQWWTITRPLRKGPFDERKIQHPPWRTKKIPGETTSRLIPPDRKKYADYYLALEEQRQLDIQWDQEDQENLHRLIEVRRFLWT
jgi:hypothetical protein